MPGYWDTFNAALTGLLARPHSIGNEAAIDRAHTLAREAPRKGDPACPPMDVQAELTELTVQSSLPSTYPILPRAQLVEAITRFLIDDEGVLINGPAMRRVCSRLADYLRAEFAGARRAPIGLVEADQVEADQTPDDLVRLFATAIRWFGYREASLESRGDVLVDLAVEAEPGSTASPDSRYLGPGD